MHIHHISDTHGGHDKITTPECDVLVHSGDVGAHIKEGYEEFIGWFSAQPAKHKIFIAGNHDFYLESEDPVVPDGVTYLKNSIVTINAKALHGPMDITFYGFPYVINLPRWAFNVSEWWIEDNFKPYGADVIICHQPAYGFKDELHKSHGGGRTGSKAIAKKLEGVEYKYYLCGHIHEARGAYKNHLNASCWNHFTNEVRPGFSVFI